MLEDLSSVVDRRWRVPRDGKIVEDHGNLVFRGGEWWLERMGIRCLVVVNGLETMGIGCFMVINLSFPPNSHALVNESEWVVNAG